ncbi:hypothetical protein EVAR_42648_1 [Eumeta japonica]|uniref:Uncharacterized protein n=1 Tax=Eumeta variegata TaxID=151549 RepID=A0A4C1WXS2_EUMVA|nr:hypothetical protein EVAR_42648_1 [Eumeta japonica]
MHGSRQAGLRSLGSRDYNYDTMVIRNRLDDAWLGSLGTPCATPPRSHLIHRHEITAWYGLPSQAEEDTVLLSSTVAAGFCGFPICWRGYR